MEHEIFHFGNRVFDVTKAKQLVTDDKIQICPIEDLTRLIGFIGVDTRYARNTDTSIPGIAASFDADSWILIDGWHRCWKLAYIEDQRFMSVYVLSQQESNSILIPYKRDHVGPNGTRYLRSR